MKSSWGQQEEEIQISNRPEILNSKQHSQFSGSFTCLCWTTAYRFWWTHWIPRLIAVSRDPEGLVRPTHAQQRISLMRTFFLTKHFKYILKQICKKAVVYTKSTKPDIVAQCRAKSQRSELEGVLSVKSNAEESWWGKHSTLGLPPVPTESTQFYYIWFLTVKLLIIALWRLFD